MNTNEFRKVKRALLSVSDKTGLVDFAKTLRKLDIDLISTGGTYAALRDAGIKVSEVASITGFPELMDGRVKTLHPKIHGGILGRREIDQEVMRDHKIDAIDLVVVNLYPFIETVADENCSESDAIEQIDIGGPAMVRSAAKNHHDVLVVVAPTDYDLVAQVLNDGQLSKAIRRQFAVKAFQHTASYDAAVAGYLCNEALPEVLNLSFEKISNLRYGENPHQQAAFYRHGSGQAATIATSIQLQGKELSFNNIADADAALECVKVFNEPACVIVKHANPCGVALDSSLSGAYNKAFATDPTSAFGGIIAFNQLLDGDTLNNIIQRQFAEVVIAPEVTEEAIEVAKKKKNLRLLTTGKFSESTRGFELKSVGGGLLLQSPDEICLDDGALRVVSKRQPTEAEMADLLFAWKVAWFVKSNAIVYAKSLQTIGVGAGQMSRIVSAKIAGIKAADENLKVPGSVMASDAFFPFRDGIDAAAEAGIRAVIQPGGSMRDDEVIQAANEVDMAMVFTGIRHFRH